MPDTDLFGVAKLYPDAGRSWHAKWNESPRTLMGVGVDLVDSQFWLRGSHGSLTIDGHGIATLAGDRPRMYVYDATANGMKWRNVEVTVYARRIAETQVQSSQGFVIGARSEHQAIDDDPHNARTYYGRLLYDGRAHFTKELFHPSGGKAINAPARPANHVALWNPPNPELPACEWIGMKFVVRNIDDDTKVRLEIFRDRSGGIGSGVWEEVAMTEDVGGWLPDDADPALDPLPLTAAATSIFIRNDFLVAAEYARFSIREIARG